MLTFRLCAMQATLTGETYIDAQHQLPTECLTQLLYMCRNLETGQEQEAHPLDEYFAELIR